MPGGVMRPQLGKQLKGQRAEQGGACIHFLLAQQAEHPQAGNPQVQRGHQIQSEGQREEQRQVVRRIPRAAQRVGGKGRAAQNQW